MLFQRCYWCQVFSDIATGTIGIIVEVVDVSFYKTFGIILLLTIWHNLLYQTFVIAEYSWLMKPGTISKTCICYVYLYNVLL